MTHTDLKQDFIEMVKENPAWFLRNLFAEEGLFDTPSFSSSNLIYCPAVMRLENNGILGLTVTVWDPYESSFSKAEYYAYARETVEEDELVWFFSTAKHWDPHEPDKAWEADKNAAAGGWVQGWQDTVTDLADHEFISEYAWGFPCSVGWARYHPEGILTAVSHPTTEGEQE